METPYRLVIGNQVLPLDIHAVAADANGNLLEVTWEGPVRFQFDHMGWLVEARLNETDAARLDLSADLGPLPFTAEARAERADLQAIVDAANAHLGRVLEVTAERRIRLVSGGSVALPLTAVSLIAAVARLLAPVTPYLELLAVFLRPPGGSGPAWRRVRR